MQIFYFLILILALIEGLFPYILICIISYLLSAVLVSFYKKTKVQKKKFRNMLQSNNSGNTALDIDNRNSTDIKSKQLEEQIQELIDLLKELKDPIKNKIVYHLQSFYIEYKQKNIQNKKHDLYEYFSFVVNNNIQTEKNHITTKERETILRIIKLLKAGTTSKDIIYSVFQEESIKLSNITTINDQAKYLNLKTNINECDEKQLHKVNSVTISQIISGLLNHAILQEKIKTDKTLSWVQIKAREQARILHNKGYIKEEIEFIKKELELCDSDSLYYKYWTLLLKSRIIENEQQNEFDLHSSIISQIISGLLIHANQEKNKKEYFNTDSFRYVVSSNNTQTNSDKINSINNDKNEKCIRNHFKLDSDISKEKVPYWEHTYVYSASYINNANQQQKQFYNHFKEEFLKGNYIDIEENYNYAFVLMFDLAEDYKKHNNYDLLKLQLKSLAEHYSITSKYTNKILLNSLIVESREVLNKTLKSYNKSNGQLCRWITSKEIIEIQGIKLTRGNFYIGECFLLPDNIIEENSLYNLSKEITHIFGPVLNPNLPIDNKKEEESIFCSYQNMSPSVRYEYLMWLSGIKKISEVSIEVLLFYLYGCEIRMFIDPETNLFERKLMIDDILQIYNFCNKKEFCCDKLLLEKLRDFIAYSIINFFRIKIDSFNIKSILNNNYTYRECFITHLITNKNVLTPEDIFDITCKVYDIEKHVPLKYTSAAKQLYLNRYAKHNNINININKSTEHIIKYIDYSNNNCNFYSEKIDLTYKIESIPKDFYNIDFAVNTCYWDIKSEFNKYNIEKEYSRGKETILSILLLPEEVEIKSIPRIQDVITYIKNEMYPNQYLTKPIDWILELFEFRRQCSKSIYQYNVDLIINGLRRIGFGIVPNYEVDNKRFNFGDTCVIYNNDENYSIKRTSTYEITELFIKLASYILQMDQILVEDLEFLDRQVLSYENTKGNQLHLTAYIRWYLQLKKQPLNKKIKDSIALLIYGERMLIANSLIKLTCINGNIHPKRIEGLKKILPILGIEVDNIHSLIHRILTDNEGFAIIEKKSDAVEFLISTEKLKENQQIKKKIILNPEKLHTFEEETKSAQKLLSEIFVDEDISVSKKSINLSNEKWKDILKLLFTKDVWQRDEVENICKKEGLMLAAILEQINDFAYEIVDDIVIEDDGEYLNVTLEYKDKLI